MRRLCLPVLALAVLMAVGLHSNTVMAQPYQAVATTNLNFRAGPGTSYPIIGAIPQGDVVIVFHCTDGYSWCDIEYAGVRGWASGRYLSYMGSGAYYGRPLYGIGPYIGLPIMRRDFPIYRRHPPRKAPAASRPSIARPPKVFRPPAIQPPSVTRPRPAKPKINAPAKRPTKKLAPPNKKLPNKMAPVKRAPSKAPPNKRLPPKKGPVDGPRP